jgi:hypothetical protein
MQKGPKSGRTSGKFVFLLFISLIISKPKNYYTLPVPTDKDKDTFVYKKPKCLQKWKITSGPNFFVSGRICPLNWPEKSVKN